MSNADIKAMLNDHSLRAFSDLMLDKFDSQKRGILDLDEFVNLCHWINPKWDKLACIKKFNEIDADRNKFADRHEFWNYAKNVFTEIIKTEINNVRKI